jgi:hypothetical protein
MGILLQVKGDCSGQVHSDQIVPGTVRQGVVSQERWLKALKTRLAQAEPSGSSLLRLDDSRDSQAGGWTS